MSARESNDGRFEGCLSCCVRVRYVYMYMNIYIQHRCSSMDGVTVGNSGLTIGVHAGQSSGVSHNYVSG